MSPLPYIEASIATDGNSPNEVAELAKRMVDTVVLAPAHPLGRHVMLAIDLSDDWNGLVRFALDNILRDYDCLTIFYAIDPSAAREEGKGNKDEFRKDVMVKVHQYTKEEKSVRPHLEHMIFRVNAEYSTSPADSILEKIKSNSDSVHGDGEFNIVVMGTRGLSGMSAMLVGSKGQRIMKESPIPVIIARLSLSDLSLNPGALSKGSRRGSLIESLTNLVKSGSKSRLNQGSIDTGRRKSNGNTKSNLGADSSFAL